jgi:hypothetical protein
MSSNRRAQISCAFSAVEHWSTGALEATIAGISLLLCGDAARTANGRRASSATAAKGLPLDGGGPRLSWLNWSGQHDEG